MRIGFDGLTITARPSGVGGAARALLAGLADLQDAPRITAALPRGSAADEDLATRPHVDVVRAPLDGPDTPRALLWQHLRMPRLLRDAGCDAHVAPAFVVPLLRAAPPAVVTIYDFSWRRFPDTKTLRFRAYMDRVVPASAARAAAVVTSSEAVRRELLREIPGVDPGRVHVIPLAARPLPAVRDADAALARLRVSRPFLLAVSNFDRRKNLAALVAAWRRIRREDGAPHALVLVGDPARAARLREDVGTRDAEPLLTPGYVSGEDLAALYATTDLVVVPSVYEGFGLPVLEAFAAGARVACSTAESLLELAAGRAIEFDPTEDGIAAGIRAALAESAAVRAAAIAGGRARAAEFTWTRTASRYLELLRAARG